MKKFIITKACNVLTAILILIFVFILYVKPNYASTFILDDKSAIYGEEVVFAIKIGPLSKSIESFGFDIEFDDKVLEYAGFLPGPLTNKFNNSGAFDINIHKKDSLRVGGYTLNPVLLNSQEELLQLKFICLSKIKKKYNRILKIRRTKDDVRGWGSRGGTFTCLGDTAEDTTNIDNISLNRNRYIPPAPKMHTSKAGESKKDKSAYNRGIRFDDESTIQYEKTSNDKNTKHGLTLIYKNKAKKDKDSSKPEPSELEDDIIFEAEGLRNGLSARYGYGYSPTIRSTFPEDGLREVPIDLSSISIVFNQSMEKISVERAFSILPQIDGRFQWHNSLTQIDFIPDSALLPCTEYHVFLTEEAKDPYGRCLDGDLDGEIGGGFSFSFKTEEVFEKPVSVPESRSASPNITRCFISTLFVKHLKYSQQNKYLKGGL